MRTHFFSSFILHHHPSCCSLLSSLGRFGMNPLFIFTYIALFRCCVPQLFTFLAEVQFSFICFGCLLITSLLDSLVLRPGISIYISFSPFRLRLTRASSRISTPPLLEPWPYQPSKKKRENSRNTYSHRLSDCYLGCKASNCISKEMDSCHYFPNLKKLPLLWCIASNLLWI